MIRIYRDNKSLINEKRESRGNEHHIFLYFSNIFRMASNFYAFPYVFARVWTHFLDKLCLIEYQMFEFVM